MLGEHRQGKDLGEAFLEEGVCCTRQSTWETQRRRNAEEAAGRNSRLGEQQGKGSEWGALRLEKGHPSGLRPSEQLCHSFLAQPL